MEFAIFALLAVGLILLVFSFRKEQSSNVEVQIENFSIQLMKEMYEVKKKLKVLEEEMMIEKTNK
ncbi:hypothetical protein A374_10520 [Fictibacillus macauensis ZFHKF-1]|uniref:Uncharacterized protein n=1 Tax=Fictibacillus macauensis ZFHKF-1 TaxID=1196324 RepID=I8UE35_9BACL|nr:hypothetical protein [Fictibacillus macauensis]EIT85170.1 hypothetical protein A374_10520 [Fictibacillus macauensis ZFHKF-1]